MTSAATDKKQLFFMGDSRNRLREFPEAVRRDFGFALDLVQAGLTPHNSRPKSGYGPGVLELAEDCAGDTYRAAYIAKLKSGIYVLHAYQKKSKSGRKIPPQDIHILKQRLKDALEEDQRRT